MKMECIIRGCRNLQTTCVECGRIICTKYIPSIDKRKDDSCQKCKNELVACVCMEVDDDQGKPIKNYSLAEMIEMAKESEYGCVWYSDKGPIQITKDGKLEPI